MYYTRRLRSDDTVSLELFLQKCVSSNRIGGNLILLKPCVFDGNHSKISEKELPNRIDQLAKLFKCCSNEFINSFSIRSLGAISSIVDTRF